MATCLKCDNCNAVTDGRDEGLPRWWSVGRYGDTMIDEPGKPTLAIPYLPPTIIISDDEMDDLDDEIDEAMAGNSVMVDNVGPEGIAVGLTLHFCKASCMAEWATQAADFES